MSAGALSGHHLGDVSQPSTSDQADGVVEAPVKFARGCKMALRLCRPGVRTVEQKTARLMSPLRVDALLMGNFYVVLYSSWLHVDAGLRRS